MAGSGVLSDSSMDLAFAWRAQPEPLRIQKHVVELGHIDETVTCFVPHPTNDLFLLGTESGAVVVWDPATQTSSQRLLAHVSDVTAIVFTPDHARFLTTSSDGFVHWWNNQFQRQHGYSSGTPLFCAALSPSGRELAAAGQDKKLRVWDCVTGSLLHTLEGHQEPITSCLWSSPGTVVTGAADGVMKVWEVDARRCVRTFRPHQALISRLVPSASGNWHFSASWDMTIKAWNARHRERFSFPAGTQAITALAPTPNDAFLAAAYWDGTVRFWNVANGKLHDEFVAHDGSLVGCCVTPDGKRLVTCGQDGVMLAFNTDEMGIARYINQHSGEVYRVVYSPDNLGVISASHDGRLRIWDRNDAQEIGCLDSNLGPTTSLAISPDRQLWAIGYLDGAIRMWDVEEQSFIAHAVQHQQAVSDLVFLPTGEHFVSGSWDMKLKLWSVESGTIDCIYDGHTGAVSAIDVSTDGRLMISASWDGTARLWDLVHRRRDVGKELRNLSGHEERVLCAAIRPDGRQAATGAADNTVRLWPLDQSVEPRILFGHDAAVTACRFTPDGRLLATADRAGVVILWNTSQGKCLGTMTHESPILCLGIAPDGQQGAIGDEVGRVRFFDISYPRGPKWIAALSTLKRPPLWKRGAAPLELFSVSCVFCGHDEGIKESRLGHPWTCPKCQTTLALCPSSLPPAPLR